MAEESTDYERVRAIVREWPPTMRIGLLGEVVAQLTAERAFVADGLTAFVRKKVRHTETLLRAAGGVNPPNGPAPGGVVPPVPPVGRSAV